MQILRAHQHRVMPWKNGGGSTTEIALSPPGAGIDGFDWRISMAVVAADGPFSAFPGIDRSLAILDGAGLVLHGLTGGPVRLERTTEPFGFPADADVAATLLEGPITDLNVMTRRGRFRSQVRRVTAAGPAELAPGVASAVLLAERPCRLTIGGRPPIDLGRRDAVRLDDPADRPILSADGAVEGAAEGATEGAVEAYLIELLPA